MERIIGFKRGSGGTAGTSYLASLVNLRFFPNCSTCAPISETKAAMTPLYVQIKCELGKAYAVARRHH